jgi:hypothetical protein
MTYHDPRDLQPSIGRNPPRYRADDDLSGGVIFALAIGLFVVFGALFYAVGFQPTTTASNPPMSTTGRGGGDIDPATGLVPKTVPPTHP